jgi:hypothetical protein
MAETTIQLSNGFVSCCDDLGTATTDLVLWILKFLDHMRNPSSELNSVHEGMRFYRIALTNMIRYDMIYDV